MLLRVPEPLNSRTRVPLALPEVRALQLDLLDRFAAHCAAHDLRYYLCAGTLLGAVRHQGFIPWDDDIDVMMPRADFDRLVATWPAAPIDGLAIAAAGDPGYPFPFAKVHDPSTLLIEEYEPAPEYGVNIDVFPLDGWPEGRLRRRLTREVQGVLQQLLLLRMLAPNPDRSALRQAITRLVRLLLAPLPRSRHAGWITALARRGPSTPTLTGVQVWGYREVVPASAYGDPITLPFERLSLAAPAAYDVVLRSLYGDYGTLPPAEKQVSHHRFQAYRLS